MWSFKTGVFGDRFDYIEIENLTEICGVSRQVVSHGSGLSRQVSMYANRYFWVADVTGCPALYAMACM